MRRVRVAIAAVALPATVWAAVAASLTGCFGGSSGSAGSGRQCRVNADCGGGKVCVSGICNAAGVVPQGGKCMATRDCRDGLYCDGGGTCAPGGALAAGQPCTLDAQCTPPLRCALDGFYGACADGGSGEANSPCQTTRQCLAGLYCGKDQTCAPLAQAFPPFAGVACGDDGPFRAYFEVPRSGRPPADFFRLPFPNDARVTAGVLDMSDFPRPGLTPLGIDLVQRYVEEWVADFDGFSGIAPVTFRFSGDVEIGTVVADSVLYVDVTPGPTLGRLLGRSWAIKRSPGGHTSKYSCNNRLVVHNSVDAPLQPRHTYAVLLTTAVKSTAGDTPAPDDDLTALLGASAPADAELMNAWNAYQPLRDWMASKGAQAPAVAAAAVFTVQDTTGRLQRLAAAVAVHAPVMTALTLCGPGVTSPCDDGTPARACGAASAAFDEIHGRFSVPIFQAGTAPYETPDDGGGIADDGGGPVAMRSEDVCFALAVPKGKTMPQAGWPLVVYHHGTGGSMRSIVTDGIAGALAGGAAPAAVFGFDAVEHGARRGSSTRRSEDLVFNLFNPRAARDNYLQGAADVVQALRLSAVKLQPSVSPTGAAIAFDPAAVAFFGHSQGARSGEIALAAGAAATPAVLSGAGAYVTNSLLESTMPADLGATLQFLIGEALDADHPVITIMQSYFDRSDPLSYAPLLLAAPPAGAAAKHVYMSWGTGDHYTPRSTLEANARALGLPPVAPVLEDWGAAPIARPVSANVTLGDGSKRTAAVVQYAPGTAYDGHFVALQNTTAVADWRAFLASWWGSGVPTVP